MVGGPGLEAGSITLNVIRGGRWEMANNSHPARSRISTTMVPTGRDNGPISDRHLVPPSMNEHV